MDFKTIQEFHWLTKIVILLTAFVFALILVAYIATVTGLSNISQGLFPPVVYLSWILMGGFLIILIIIIIHMVIIRIKRWIEKYMDTLVEGKNINDRSDAKLALICNKIDDIEKKVDNIEQILENVSE